MPLAAEVFRGKARVSGSQITFDVILYPIADSVKLGQEFSEDVVQDEVGRDISWRAVNSKLSADIGLILIDKSDSSTAAHAAAGAVFLNPYDIVTVTDCPGCATMVASWQYISGASIDLNSGQVGKAAIKLRRYSDTAQNALAVSTPG